MKEGDTQKDLVVINGTWYVPLPKDFRGHIGMIWEDAPEERPAVILRPDRREKDGLPFISFWNVKHDKKKSTSD